MYGMVFAQSIAMSKAGFGQRDGIVDRNISIWLECDTYDTLATGEPVRPSSSNNSDGSKAVGARRRGQVP